jgi:hypothetical protein
VTALDVRKALAYLASAYPARAKELSSPETGAAWATVLGDVPLDVLRASVKTLATTRYWPPSASEVRRKCLELAGYRPPLPAEAFAAFEVEWQGSRYRPPPKWSHPAIAATVKAIGGLERARDYWRVEDYTSHRARFVETYTALLERHESELLALPWDGALASVKSGNLLGPASAGEYGLLPLPEAPASEE